MTPMADWSLQSLDAEASGSTDARARPRAGHRCGCVGRGERRVRQVRFQLSPFAVSASLKLAGFDLTRIKPYITDPEVTPESGVVGATIDVSFKRTGPKVEEAWAGGESRGRRPRPEPHRGPGAFHRHRAARSGDREGRRARRTITVASVAIEGADIGVVRRPSARWTSSMALARLIERRAAEERARRGARRGAPTDAGRQAAPPDDARGTCAWSRSPRAGVTRDRRGGDAGRPVAGRGSRRQGQRLSTRATIRRPSVTSRGR